MSTLADYRGKHAGQPCAILCPGPSLRHITPEHLAGFVAVTVNAAYVKFPDAPYHVTCDYGTRYFRRWPLIQANENCTVFAERGAQLAGDNVVAFERRRGYGMHPNDEKTVIGTSSAHCAVNIAVVMHCSPIVLIGCESCYEDGKLHFHQFDGEPKDGLRPDEELRARGTRPDDIAPIRQHYVLRRNEKKDDDSFFLHFRFTWNAIRKTNPRLEIYNASGGRLEAFPRIEMSALPDIVPVT